MFKASGGGGSTSAPRSNSVVQREGRPEDPARAGDHRGPGPAPPAQGAGGQRHRQPEADRDAAQPGHGGAREGQRQRPPGRAHGRRGRQEGRHRQGRPSTPRAAESFANRLIAARDARSRTSRRCTCRPPRPPTRPRRPSQQNATALQKKLSERQKLLGQLDQAKMQEQMNKAMASLSETVGQDVPTLDEVRDKIEARYAKAKGMSELHRGVGREPDARGRAGRREHRGPGPPGRDPRPARPRARRAAARRRAARRSRRAEPAAEPAPADPPTARATAPAPSLERLRQARRGRRGGRPRGATPSGRSAVRRPATPRQASTAPTRTRPLANTPPSGPATSTASSASKRPSTPTHAGRAAATRRARPAPGGPRRRPRPCPLDPTAKAIQSLRAGSRLRLGAARPCPTPGTPATASASTPSRSAAAMTARTPDQAAILAAATFDAMPPLPRAVPGAAGQRLERVVDLDDLLDERRRRVEAGVGGEQPGRVGEQHEQVGARRRWATRAASRSLSPKRISSSAMASFSLTTGTTPSSSSRPSVPRAWRYCWRTPKSSGASSTWPPTRPCAAEHARRRPASAGSGRPPRPPAA